MNDTTPTTDRDMTHPRAQELYALDDLALADEWVGAEGHIGDVRSAARWLCECAYQPDDCATVTDILSRYVAGDISIADARAELDRVLS